MPFIYKDSGDSNAGRILIPVLLNDSTTYTIGDALKASGTDGDLVLAGAGGAFLGFLAGFRKSNGAPLTDNGAGGDYVDTYTTPASNTVVGLIDISKKSIYSVTADATLGTTTGSDKFGVCFDMVAASDQLDESSVQAAGTSAQLFSHGVDPDESAPDNSVLVSIQESQYDL